ncbi:MAG: carbohydrate ABC transporter permease [Candidatus Limnocylindrales bacterium]|jgi:raffinose/stachyose/melibiose transport system permease protein
MGSSIAAEGLSVHPTRKPTRGNHMWSGAMRVVQAYGILLGLIALLFVVFAPFVIIAINAVKTPTDLAANGPLSLPQNPTLDNMVAFWNAVDFGGALRNSFVISLSVAILATILSLLNAFALGIGRVRGAVWFLVFFMLANILPNEAIVYPLYYMAKFAGLYNTQLSVVIIFTVIQSAFGTYFIASVMRAFPREILDAARVDGCGKVQLLVRVVVPIMRPSLGVLMVFAFIWTWNEFYLPLVFLVSNAQYTVPLAVAATQGEHMMNESQVAASALLGVLPCVVFFVLFQRTLTRGITLGSYR